MGMDRWMGRSLFDQNKNRHRQTDRQTQRGVRKRQNPPPPPHTHTDTQTCLAAEQVREEEGLGDAEGAVELVVEAQARAAGDERGGPVGAVGGRLGGERLDGGGGGGCGEREGGG